MLLLANSFIIRQNLLNMEQPSQFDDNWNQSDLYPVSSSSFILAQSAAIETLNNFDGPIEELSKILKEQEQLLEQSLGEGYIGQRIGVTGFAHKEGYDGEILENSEQALTNDELTLQAVGLYQLEDGGEVGRAWTVALSFNKPIHEKDTTVANYIMPVESILALTTYEAEDIYMKELLNKEAAKTVKLLSSQLFLSAPAYRQDEWLDEQCKHLETLLAHHDINTQHILSVTTDDCFVQPVEQDFSIDTSYMPPNDMVQLENTVSGVYRGICFVDRRDEFHKYTSSDDFLYTKGNPCVILFNDELQCFFSVRLDKITSLTIWEKE